MVERIRRLPPALKHGGYSVIGLLPGEDRSAFERLHRALIAEMGPNGEMEDDTVLTMAYLLWRKQNLATVRIAERAQSHYRKIEAEKLSDGSIINFGEIDDPAAREEAIRAAKDQAREELGDAYEFVEMSREVSHDQLMAELEVLNRLDARSPDASNSYC
jgi:hypothetical protein